MYTWEQEKTKKIWTKSKEKRPPGRLQGIGWSKCKYLMVSPLKYLYYLPKTWAKNSYLLSKQENNWETTNKWKKKEKK